MENQPVVIGTHAFFAREADGTSSRTVKPAAGTAAWLDLSVIEESGVETAREERELWAPSPGALRLYDIIEVKHGLTFKFKVRELTLLMFELMFGTLALTGSANIQYNPLEGVTKKGWLKVQHYTHKDVLINVVDVWVQLKLAGEVSMADDLVSFDVEARVLHSTLNTGTLNPS